MMTTATPGSDQLPSGSWMGSSRENAVERAQLWAVFRFVSDWASSKFFTGSSISRTVAPLPVAGPPTPAVRMPPPAIVSQLSAAVVALFSRGRRCSGALSSTSRALRPQSRAKSAS
jgi:hypothetical protein